MPKRLAKTAAWIVVAFLLYVIAHGLLAYYPGALFSHRRTYKNFTVHMHEEIPDEIVGVLDRVELLLSTSELNDPTLHHSVYLIDSPRLTRFLLLREIHFGASLPNGAVYISDGDVTLDVARTRRLGPYDHRSRTLSESIAHEIAHHLLRRHLGLRADWRLPTWLREGYCEYVAQGMPIDEETGLGILMSPRGAIVPGYPLFQDRLLVEYLLNVRGLTLDELTSSPPSPAETKASVRAGLIEDPVGFRARLRARSPDTSP